MFQALAKKHGKVKFDEMRKILSVVNEDNDVYGAETLLELEKKYGPQVLKEAVDIIQLKKEDNPKRSMGYLIGTIKGIGEKTLEKPAT